MKMRDCDGWACRPEQNQQVALKSTVNLAVTRGEGAKKSQNEPIKQLTARIDALNNMVDALQHTIAAQVERGCQCLASQPVSSKVESLAVLSKVYRRRATGLSTLLHLQWGGAPWQLDAWDDFSGREMGTGHCRGTTSDRRANVPNWCSQPNAVQTWRKKSHRSKMHQPDTKWRFNRRFNKQKCVISFLFRPMRKVHPMNIQFNCEVNRFIIY